MKLLDKQDSLVQTKSQPSFLVIIVYRTHACLNRMHASTEVKKSAVRVKKIDMIICGIKVIHYENALDD